MAKTPLRFAREYELPIFYYGHKIGARRVDFLIEDRLPIELKAIETLEDIHLAQAKNYLEAFELRVGLLINFGSKSLQVKRLINSKAPIKHRNTKSETAKDDSIKKGNSFVGGNSNPENPSSPQRP